MTGGVVQAHLHRGVLCQSNIHGQLGNAASHFDRIMPVPAQLTGPDVRFASDWERPWVWNHRFHASTIPGMGGASCLHLPTRSSIRQCLGQVTDMATSQWQLGAQVRWFLVFNRSLSCCAFIDWGPAVAPPVNFSMWLHLHGCNHLDWYASTLLNMQSSGLFCGPKLHPALSYASKCMLQGCWTNARMGKTSIQYLEVGE